MKTNEELKAFAKQVVIKPRVELENEEEKAVIYLYGPIIEEVPRNWLTDEPEKGEYIIPQNVRDMFEEIGSEKEVDIHLNSNGGDVYASVAICNFIRDRKNTVNIYIDAIAASGASIIAMSADNLFMYPNSMMMIHRASAFVYGNTEELAKVSEDLKKFDQVVSASYMNRFKGTEEELTDLISEETYFTAKECLAVGLTDEVIEPIKKQELEKPVENKKNLQVKASLLERFVKEEPKKNNLLNKFKGDK